LIPDDHAARNVWAILGRLELSRFGGLRVGAAAAVRDPSHHPKAGTMQYDGENRLTHFASGSTRATETAGA